MTPEITDFATWEEAAYWLATHGWGTGLIEQQKILWDEASAAEAAKVVKGKITKAAVATE